METVSITDIIHKKIQNKANYESRQNIFDYMNRYNIGNKGTLTQYQDNIIFKEQMGGTEHNIKLKDGFDYKYYVDDLIPLSETDYRLCFVSMTHTYDCACLLFGNSKSGNDTLRIEGLFSSPECIQCDDPKNKFKAGDIIIQIILIIVKTNKIFSHIRQIELADASKKSCYDIGIELIYLRTITHGKPFYAKYGFRPENENDYKNVYRNNYLNYKLNKMITNIELFKIITNSKVNMNIGTYEVYKKYFYEFMIKQHIIDPKIFFMDIIKLIDDSMSNEKIKQDNIFLGNKLLTNPNDMKSICDFVNAIYKNVYKYLGYTEYFSKIWILKLNK